jgi:hypothetical protein
LKLKRYEAKKLNEQVGVVSKHEANFGQDNIKEEASCLRIGMFTRQVKRCGESKDFRYLVLGVISLIILEVVMIDLVAEFSLEVKE